MDSTSSHHTFWEEGFPRPMHLCPGVPEYATFSKEADVLSVDDSKIGCCLMDRNALVFFLWVSAYKYRYFIYLLMWHKWPQYFSKMQGTQSKRSLMFLCVSVGGKEEESENQNIFTKIIAIFFKFFQIAEFKLKNQNKK